MVVDVSTGEWAFYVNDRVEKHGGAYTLAGVVVSAFRTLAGAERYVVEHAPAAPGLLHIYGPQNLRPLQDGGLSPETRAWLASAGNRLNEPVREDRPEDVQARLAGATPDPVTGHPQVGPPWDLTDDEARRFADATMTDTLPAGWRLRPGASWLGKDGPLCTVAAHDPDEPPDGAGRRPSDVLVGVILTGLGQAACDAYNTRADLAARLRPAFEALDAALPAGPCPSDPCPLCTAMEGLQSLLLQLEGRV